MDDNLPIHHIETCVPEKREPGMMVFNVRPGGSAEAAGQVGWFVGVNQTGEFALNLSFDNPAQDVRALANGNLLMSLTSAGLILEVTRSGDPVRQWHIAGKWRDKAPPAGCIAIDIELNHHTINVMPDGNLLLLTAEMREFPDWPANDIDPDAPLGPAKVIGDVILEVAPEGSILRRWAMLDILDPYRLSYGSCSAYWQARGFPDSNDWCHTNAITYDARDDSIIASLRTQDCMIKIDYGSGELKWILGDHGNWKSPWSEKLLTPVGDVEWPYHQHDCSVTPDGTILCFDNGNFRAVPFGPKMTPADNYSRAVEFDVDEADMTVRQVWAYGKVPGERLFAAYQGGAFRLPQTGNTFINYGGICIQDGEPSGEAGNSFTRGRVVEVTSENEVVFDMWLGPADENHPQPLSSFRAEFVADL